MTHRLAFAVALVSTILLSVSFYWTDHIDQATFWMVTAIFLVNIGRST